MTQVVKQKGKHITHAQRITIQHGLEAALSLREISDLIGKDPTTISKEIRRNRVIKESKRAKEKQKCLHHGKCKRQHLCSTDCRKQCKKCVYQNCYYICPDYTIKKCQQVNRYPHVCNGCSHKITCRENKYYYRGDIAQKKYEVLLKEAREGIHASPEDIHALDALISEKIIKGQPIHHIYTHHANEIPCCERTLYHYVDKCQFSARNIDLPRKVKYKPRKSKSKSRTRDITCRKGRTYDDFKEYLKANPDSEVVEMDTVEGKKQEDPHLLTLLFRHSSVMLIFLLEKNTAECVKATFDAIIENIGKETFKKSFPILLTDNGSEFKRPESIEFDSEGTRQTRLFYCDPGVSGQKGALEVNHKFIRYFIPKGKSFDTLTKEKVTLMMNHINSTARASLKGRTPIKLAQILLDQKIINGLHLKEIHPDEVHLKPALLK